MLPAVWASAGALGGGPPAASTGTPGAGALPGTITQEIPKAAYSFRLVLVPGAADGSIGAFYMSEREITWEAFDTFVYKLDEEQGLTAASDAVTRPSKPYLPPDRGFGHEGYAAISLSFKNASEFCDWLSERSGRKFRLPTEAEWEHAAGAGRPGTPPWGEDVSAVGHFAVYAGNSEGKPAPAGSKAPNAWGLFDMLGNVQEWVVGGDGKPVTKGGSYRDGAEKLTISGRAAPAPSWNASDPQVPKSQWWLSDGPFVGFRVVMEPPESAGGDAKKDN
jgi:formylglycine-generating enzyme required for sulfatase activity